MLTAMQRDRYGVRDWSAGSSVLGTAVAGHTGSRRLYHVQNSAACTFLSTSEGRSLLGRLVSLMT